MPCSSALMFHSTMIAHPLVPCQTVQSSITTSDAIGLSASSFTITKQSLTRPPGPA